MPITLLGAGLPQIAELAGEAKSYSERLFKFPQIGVLSASDAEVALTEPAKGQSVAFEAEVTKLAYQLTGGYPYFLQEVGSAAWTKGLLYTLSHGYAAFAVPHFDKFMLRAVPELVVPEVRARRSGKHAANPGTVE